MRRIFLPLAIILVAALISGALYWYFVLSKESTSIGTPSPTPTPAKKSSVTLGELVLCKDFQKVENEISCEEAIRIATLKYSGRAQDIIQGRGFPKKDIGPASVMRSFWRIGILLNKPVQKDQETFNSARLYLDRETGEELAGGYIKSP